MPQRFAWNMHTTCSYASCMSHLQIRNVPEVDHRRLKARAAMEGRSVSEHALSVLRRSLERPTVEEFLERLERQSQTTGNGGVEVDAAALVREMRDTR